MVKTACCKCGKPHRELSMFFTDGNPNLRCSECIARELMRPAKEIRKQPHKEYRRREKL